RAVAHQRIGADGAAMRQVLEDEEAVLDDLVRLLALHVGDEADAAGIVLVARIIESLRRRQAGRHEGWAGFRSLARAIQDAGSMRLDSLHHRRSSFGPAGQGGWQSVCSIPAARTPPLPP